MAIMRFRNAFLTLLFFGLGVLLSGCTLNTRLVVTNDRAYAIKIVEKYKNAEGGTSFIEAGVVPAKQTKDFGRVLTSGGEQEKYTFELRNAQDKVIEQVTAVKDETTHDVVNLHINR